MVQTKFYWREVIGIGSNYIDIRKGGGVGVSIPEAGDHIFQLGNLTDTDRQSAQIISSYGKDAPSIKMYRRINSFSLEGKETLVLSPNRNILPGDTTIGGSDISIDDLTDILGTEEYKMDIESSEGTLMVDQNFTSILTAKVLLFFKDVTNDVISWVWSRQSGVSAEAVNADALWTYNQRNNNTNIVSITADDIPGPKVKFVCDATINDTVVRGII